MECPACHVELKRTKIEDLLVYSCADCHGIATTVAIVRKTTSPELAAKIWQGLPAGHATAGRACPGCKKPMHEASLPGSTKAMVLDVCRRCQLVWFDASELDSLRKEVTAPPPIPPELPMEAQKALALLELERLRNTMKREKDAELAEEGRRMFELFDWLPF